MNDIRTGRTIKAPWLITRRKPRIDAPKQATLKYGAHVNVCLVVNDWGQTDKGWIEMKYVLLDPIAPPADYVPPPDFYRTLHPYPATHDGLCWPARPHDYPVAPNNGSFDVYSRLYTKPSKSSDGGAIKLTSNQWEAILRKNIYSRNFVKWAVGGTQKIMMWQDGKQLPVFHYPLCFGGNLVNVLEFYGKFARIATWPMDQDVPDDLPEYYWNRCWCVYKNKKINDAPMGILHAAKPAFMLLLAHSDSAWIYRGGLIK